MDHKKHWEKIITFGCCICGGLATIHHCKGGSMIDWFGSVISPRGTRCNHFLVLPLCEYHHTGDEGIDAMPTREWESRFGTQASHLLVLNRRLYYSIWDLQGVPDLEVLMANGI